MTKKLFVEIINLIKQQDELDRKVSEGIELINSSYTILEMDKYTRKALYLLLESIFGESGLDNISWWLYEKVDKIIYSKDKKGKITNEKKIETTEDLYDYCMGIKK